MGVGPQKEWRGSAADWRRKVDLGAVSVAVSTGANRRVATRGCKNFEEIKVSNALELVPWAIDFDSRATLAGSSRTGPRYQRPLYREQALVDCGTAAPRRPAPQCAVHREKAVQRLLEVSATSPSACGPLVLGRINGELEIADGACFSPAIKLFMLLGAPCCVIAASWRPSSKAL